MNEPTNIVISDECIKQMIHTSVLLAVMLFLGSIGGIARGAFDRLSNSNFREEPMVYFWVKHIFIGMAGASSAVFATLLLSKYKLEINDIQSLILFSTLSVLGGVMAKRCLPALGDRLSKEIEQKFKEQKNENDQRFGSIESKVSKVEETLTYRELIDRADKSLSDMNPFLMKETISQMEKAIEEHGVDRQFIIKLGRLYRRVAEKGEEKEFNTFIDKAIKLLKDFIDLLRDRGLKNNDVKSAIGTAYYNIACYYILKSRRQKEDNRLKYKKEAIKALKTGLRLAPHMRSSVKDDEDLSEISDQI